MLEPTKCAQCPTFFPKTKDFQTLCITCYKANQAELKVKNCDKCEKEYKTNKAFSTVCPTCYKEVMTAITRMNSLAE